MQSVRSLVWETLTIRVLSPIIMLLRVDVCLGRYFGVVYQQYYFLFRGILAWLLWEVFYLFEEWTLKEEIAVFQPVPHHIWSSCSVLKGAPINFMALRSVVELEYTIFWQGRYPMETIVCGRLSSYMSLVLLSRCLSVEMTEMFGCLWSDALVICESWLVHVVTFRGRMLSALRTVLG